MKKPKTVEDYVELIEHVGLYGSGGCAGRTLINGAGETHEKPGSTWFVLTWAAKGIGFGEATFEQNGDEIKCHDETMGATFIEALLVKLARKAKMTGK